MPIVSLSENLSVHLHKFRVSLHIDGDMINNIVLHS